MIQRNGHHSSVRDVKDLAAVKKLRAVQLLKSSRHGDIKSEETESSGCGGDWSGDNFPAHQIRIESIPKNGSEGKE